MRRDAFHYNVIPSLSLSFFLPRLRVKETRCTRSATSNGTARDRSWRRSKVPREIRFDRGMAKVAGERDIPFVSYRSGCGDRWTEKRRDCEDPEVSKHCDADRWYRHVDAHAGANIRIVDEIWNRRRLWLKGYLSPKIAKLITRVRKVSIGWFEEENGANDLKIIKIRKSRIIMVSKVSKEFGRNVETNRTSKIKFVDSKLRSCENQISEYIQLLDQATIQRCKREIIQGSVGMVCTPTIRVS